MGHINNLNRKRNKFAKFIKETFPLRIIKTAIAFLLSLSLAPIFKIDSFFAGVGALKTMQPSITLSIKEIFNQTFANIIGIIFAVAFSLIFGINPFSVSVALLSLFLVIKYTNVQETYLTAAFVLIAVMFLSTNQQELYERAFTRTIANIFGMIIALIVNIILFRPKKGEELEVILRRLNEVIHLYMSNGLDEYSASLITQNLEDLKSERDIIKNELNVSFISSNRKAILRDRLKEVEIVIAQVDMVKELPTLSNDLVEEIIPIIIQLNFIKHYEQDKSKIPEIKDDIRKVYLNNTSKYDFFSNSSFLSALNNYLNLLLEY